MLDEAGFRQSAIVASNDLDEHLIESLKRQGAAINIWGVGTKLATAFDQPALGGVYKLAAIRTPKEAWQYKLKLSEQKIKISTPGIQQVRRFVGDQGEFIGDMIHDVTIGVEVPVIVDPMDMTRRKKFPVDAAWSDLLIPIFREGQLVYTPPSITTIRASAQDQIQRFSAGIKRLENPHEYPVGLEPRLHRLKNELILKARGLSAESADLPGETS